MAFPLPKSGIEIDGPYLRIAPVAHPIIELDARLLDDVVAVEPRGQNRRVATASGVGVGSVLLASVAGEALVWLPFVVGAFVATQVAAWARERDERLLRLDLGSLRSRADRRLRAHHGARRGEVGLVGEASGTLR